MGVKPSTLAHPQVRLASYASLHTPLHDHTTAMQSGGLTAWHMCRNTVHACPHRAPPSGSAVSSEFIPVWVHVQPEEERLNAKKLHLLRRPLCTGQELKGGGSPARCSEGIVPLLSTSHWSQFGVEGFRSTAGGRSVTLTGVLSIMSAV